MSFQSSDLPIDNPTVRTIKVFAMAVAMGLPYGLALHRAGFTLEERTPEKAMELLRNEIVRDLVLEYAATFKSNALISRELLYAQLASDRELSYANENPAAAVAATIAQARLLGFMDPSEKARVPNNIKITWETSDGPETRTIRDPLLRDAIGASMPAKGEKLN